MFALSGELSRRLRHDLSEVTVRGAGGAYERSGIKRLYASTAATEWAELPRVLWWAVDRSPHLANAQRELRDALNRLGIDDQYLPTNYQPHITLGSTRGPATAEDAVWDVHGAAKDVTLPKIPHPVMVPVQRLHITEETLNPQALVTITDYDQPVG